MLLIIGPGEELFWRGFLQRNMSLQFGRILGFILTTVVYAGVHVASGNIMLVLAALVCGIFWGWLYLRYQSMIINVVSHTLWDISVFMLFPFL
jgi:membrane protease YdiL (CAAX protease family)